MWIFPLWHLSYFALYCHSWINFRPLIACCVFITTDTIIAQYRYTLTHPPPPSFYQIWPPSMSPDMIFTACYINSLRPRRNVQHFADDIFKLFFFNENVWISIKISLIFVPKGPINNIPSLDQIMDWRRSGDKPLSEPMMVRSPTYICVTWPQWVKRTTVAWNYISKISVKSPKGQWVTELVRNESYFVLVHVYSNGYYWAPAVQMFFKNATVACRWACCLRRLLGCIFSSCKMYAYHKNVLRIKIRVIVQRHNCKNH